MSFNVCGRFQSISVIQKSISFAEIFIKRYSAQHSIYTRKMASSVVTSNEKQANGRLDQHAAIETNLKLITKNLQVCL